MGKHGARYRNRYKAPHGPRRSSLGPEREPSLGIVLVGAFLFPAHVLSSILHKVLGVDSRRRKLTRLVAAASLWSLGPYLAAHVPIWWPHDLHFIWDGIGYTFHGIGSIPFVVAAESYLSGRNEHGQD